METSRKSKTLALFLVDFSLWIYGADDLLLDGSGYHEGGSPARYPFWQWGTDLRNPSMLHPTVSGERGDGGII